MIKRNPPASYNLRSLEGGPCQFVPFSLVNRSIPEIIAKMSLALESVCEALGLRLVDDPATRLVAEKIIELAQRGVRDAAALSATTLKELKSDRSP